MTMTFKQAVDRGASIKALYGARNTMYDNMENMYLLKWDDEEKTQELASNVKITKSPDARNRAKGAMRLMIATEPRVSVPRDKNNISIATQADKIEKWAQMTWRSASRVARFALHNEVVRSMVLFDEVHIGITCTADMLQYASNQSPAIKARTEAIAKATPFMFDVWDPRTGYPEFDSFGLISYYREVETTASSIRNNWGSLAQPALAELKDDDLQHKFVLCDYWDFDQHFVWLADTDTPIVEEKNQHPFIPVIVGSAEGTTLFSLPEDQHEPFLRTIWDSQIWQRQNLILTAMGTNVFSFGVEPQFVYNGMIDNFALDFSKNVQRINPNETLAPLMKQVIDPSLHEFKAMLDSRVDESTIQSQTLGAPVQGNPSFSLVSLLHQAGRLAILAIQRGSSNVIADALKIAVMWAKSYGKQTARYKGEEASLSPADIPEYFELECKLEASLPQDNLQQANIARTLRGMLSDAWIMENVLNIENPTDEQKRAMKEIAASQQFQLYLQKMAEAMLQVQGQLPPGGQQPQEQMPPDLGGQMAEPMPPTSTMPPAPGMMPGAGDMGEEMMMP